MMFFGFPSILAWHGIARHAHCLRLHRLIGMREHHRTAVQNERKRKDEGNQSLMQPNMHDGSRAKSRADVHRIAFCKKYKELCGTRAELPSAGSRQLSWRTIIKFSLTIR